MSLKESILLEYGNRLAFLERAATWIFGWRAFNLYPWFGVGLGNSGFFALEQMPSMGWASVEIRIRHSSKYPSEYQEFVAADYG